MQTDMHYFATYSLARAAGFRQDVAHTIALCAEYVDDSAAVNVRCKDGFEIRSRATAHHPLDYSDNTDPEDQKRTWVPFHFIPGLQGDSVEEKLVCVTDSAAARQVVAHTLQNLDKGFSLQLLGILAHSYIDTFSHYGFSGISSRLNKVSPESFEFPESADYQVGWRSIFERFTARYVVGPAVNHLAQLGHGAVATFPDQPFLNWSFRYEATGQHSGVRENPRTFLTGCQRLHEVLVEARNRFDPEAYDKLAYRDFSDIEKALREVLAATGDDNARADAWRRAVRGGRLGGTAEEIPDYRSSKFTDELSQLAGYEEKFARKTFVYKFLEAADCQRNFILNDLLPRNNVHIEALNIEWHWDGAQI